MEQAATIIPDTAYEQEQEFGIYDISHGVFILLAGPESQTVCREVAEQFPKDIPPYVLPFAGPGQVIGPDQIADLIASGYLSSGFTFPPIERCPRCRRDVDTKERHGKRICCICYTPTLPL